MVSFAYHFVLPLIVATGIVGVLVAAWADFVEMLLP